MTAGHPLATLVQAGKVRGVNQKHAHLSTRVTNHISGAAYVDLLMISQTGKGEVGR